jgi:hypothetical protein
MRAHPAAGDQRLEELHRLVATDTAARSDETDDSRETPSGSRGAREAYALYFLVPLGLGAAGTVARLTSSAGLPTNIAWALGVALGIGVFAAAYRRMTSGEDDHFQEVSRTLTVREAVLWGCLPFVCVLLAVGIVYLFDL